MKFQNTPIGKIPSDWHFKKVQDIFEVKTGTTPSTKKADYWKKGTVTWVTPTDMNKIEGIKIADSDRKITEKALKETNLNLLPKESIIISTRAPVGYVALNSEEITFNQGCKGLVPKDPNTIDTLFFYYYLLGENNRLQHLSAGSTFKELSKDTLKKIDLPIPSLVEQEKIAQILNITDQAILKSDEIINKTHGLKKGIMHKLMTEGIGHKEFKDTDMGRIPVDWNIIPLNDFIEVKGGYAFKSKDYTKTGIPLIRIANVSFGKVVFEDLVRVPNSYLETHHEFSLKPGDIVMALTRPIIGGGIKAGQIENIHTPALLNQRVGLLRVLNDNVMSNKFLFWTIFSENFVNQMKKGLFIMNQPNISTKQIGMFKIPLPPKVEQDNISNIISLIDEKYRVEIRRKEKLKKVKKSLMNDLLTGIKRVIEN